MKRINGMKNNHLCLQFNIRGFDIMDIEMTKFEKTAIGWRIVFKANLTIEESSNCNIDSLNTIGDYDISVEDNSFIFGCDFDKGELKKSETIEDRLELIKKDINSILDFCIKN